MSRFEYTRSVYCTPADRRGGVREVFMETLGGVWDYDKGVFSIGGGGGMVYVVCGFPLWEKGGGRV